MSDILEGIRIIDWSLYHVGPVAAAKLGDLGAEVIKIEERGVGDPQRGVIKLFGSPIGLPHGRQVNFEFYNRNKKSLAVDLKKSRGKEILYRLIEKSDVFVTNFRAKAAVKLGLDYQTLQKYNSKLIYASASPFGRKGPDADIPAVDLTGQARGGIMMTSGEPGMPPIQVAPGVSDQVTAVNLAYGVLAALFARERTGIGQEVHVSMLGSMVELQGFLCTYSLLTGKHISRQKERTKVQNPLYNYYKCKSDQWIALAMVQSDRQWPAICEALEVKELISDPRFANMDKRAENCEELISILDRVFSTKTYEEWRASIMKFPDVIFSVINDIPGLMRDPQVVENDYIVDFNHPDLGPIKFPGQSVQFGKTPGSLRTGAPECGQHTEEVLLEVCGYKWDEINQLREEEVI